MKKNEFLLCVIDAKGGSIRGRTLLQKTCYFVSILLNRARETDFKAHFYGPYSPTIDETLNEMVSLGLLQQRQIRFGAADSSGFEIRRNDFELTEAGRELIPLIAKKNQAEWTKVEASVLKIQQAGDPNYVELSIAAKVYFIVSSRNERLTKEAIIRHASSLGWNIERESTDKAISFLEKLELVKNK